ncbi:hypothetical protein CDAR_103091 [Caerostris darwini]|uniref:Uncharacterized protein n=1 Tax=Caerostris darwini TaxID=1538125 RepID=A0AAV4V3R8_9ARAC|nr:hypothetical protein CDAR_103091 [Caerostris darwini]
MIVLMKVLGQMRALGGQLYVRNPLDLSDSVKIGSVKYGPDMFSLILCVKYGPDILSRISYVEYGSGMLPRILYVKCGLIMLSRISCVKYWACSLIFR